MITNINQNNGNICCDSKNIEDNQIDPGINIRKNSESTFVSELVACSELVNVAQNEATMGPANSLDLDTAEIQMRQSVDKETAGMQGANSLLGQTDQSVAVECKYLEADSGCETADAEGREDTQVCIGSHSTDTGIDTETEAEINMVKAPAYTASHTEHKLSLKKSIEKLKHGKMKQSGKLINQYEREYRLLHKRLGKEEVEKEGEINKVAKLATELSRRKYKFPSQKDEAKEEDMVTTDNRTVLECYKDIIDQIQDKYSDSDLDFLNSIVGYDSSIQQYSSEGVPLPDSLVKQLSAEYKQMHGIVKINEAYEQWRGIPIKHKVKKKPKKLDQEDLSDSEIESEGSACLLEAKSEIDIVPREQIGKFCDFVSKDPSVLLSKGQKRMARTIKKLYQQNNRIGKKLTSFLTEFNKRYFLDNEYVDPVSQPQVLLLAAGDRLMYAKCTVLGRQGQVEMELLIDSGATHNILPRTLIEKYGLLVEAWRPRRGFPLTTAGQQVNNAILSECLVKVFIECGGQNYNLKIPFLVCNEQLQINMPILGKSFLNEFRCDEQHRTQADGTHQLLLSAEATETGAVCRVVLPTTEWPGNKTSNLYNIQGMLAEAAAEPELTENECVDINSVQADEKLDNVLSFLGGDGVMVEQPIREDLDEEAFRQIDLLEALNATPPVSQPKTTTKLQNYDKHMKKLELINAQYKNSFASGDKQCGEFLLGIEIDPEVIEGKSAKQAKRTSQDHSVYSAVTKQMDKLEKEGIIEVSDNQEVGQFCHNLLTVPKKPPGSALRQWTKADQQIEGRNSKMSKEDLPVRVLADLTTLNFILKAKPSISLPEEHAVKTFIKNKMISLYDIKNGYFSLRVKESAKVLFNFYYKNMIYTYARMPQGLASAPFFFMCAMARMLGDSAWDDFYAAKKNKLKHIFSYAKSYDDICKYYLDDIIQASPLICTCSGGMYNCEKGFKCENLDVNKSVEMHIECHEAILFACQRAGMLLESTKCSHFTQHSFVFLGVEYCATNSTYSIAKERVSSVLSFRVPRSCAELNSRLSSIFYSAPFLPWLKKLSLRLAKVVKSGHFVWGKEEMETFNNLKMLTALAISKSFFDPNAHLWISCDSSKFSSSYCIFQLLPSGVMEMIESDTVALNGSESRNSPVQRELANLVWALNKAEKYLLSSHNDVHVIGDALCIQYLRNQRHWDSRCGHIALLLSKYDRLRFLWLPGRFLGVVDQMSRQFHDVFINKQDSDLSKEMSQILVPLPGNLKDKIFKMSGRQLTDFIMSTQVPRPKIDLWDKGSLCLQSYREDDIKLLYNECGPIQSLVAFLKDPYNPKHLSTNAAKHYFGVLSGATKTKIDNFIKTNQLDKFKEVLSNIDYQTTWRQFFPSAELLSARANEPIVQVNMLTRSRTAACSLVWKPENVCEHFKCNNDALSPGALKIFATNMKQYEKTIEGLFKHWEKSRLSFKSEMMTAVDLFRRSECLVERFFCIKNVARILRECPGDQWFFPEKTQLCFVPYFGNDKFDIVVTEKKGNLCIIANKRIVIKCLEHVRFKCWIAVIDNDSQWECKIVSAPTGYHVSTFLPCMITTSVSLFNQSAHTVVIKEGDVLFRLVRPGQGDRVTSFVRLEENKGQKLLQEVGDMQHQWAYTNLEEIFCDFLVQSHVNLVKPAVWSQNLKVSTVNDARSRVRDTERLREIHESNISENDGFLNFISNKNKKKSHLTDGQNFEGQWNLQTLLFGHRMRQTDNQLRTDDIKALQQSDPQIKSIIEKIENNVQMSSTNDSEEKFYLEKGILYKKLQNVKRNIIYTVLVIPRFLMKELFLSLHLNKQVHLNTNDIVNLVRIAFWSPKMKTIAQKCRESCHVCLYAQKASKRQTKGQIRLHLRDNNTIKSVIEADLLFLPKDKTSGVNSDVMLVLACPLTNFTWCYPLRNKGAGEVCRGLATFISIVGTFKILKSDAGPEFCAERVTKFLQSLGISHYIISSKNSTSTVERQIGVYKQILNELVQRNCKENNRWGQFWLLANILMQSRPVRGGSFLTRMQAFFSPYHYENPMFRLVGFNSERPLKQLYKSFHSNNELRLKGKDKKIVPWQKGQLLKTHVPRSAQSSVNNSQQLLPTCSRFLKVIEPAAGSQSAICEDLLSSEEFKYSNADIRALQVGDFPLPRGIMIKNLKDVVPKINSKRFARQIFNNKIQPTCFLMEPSRSKSCLSMSRFLPQTKSTPLRGVLESEDSALLDAYISAYWTLKDTGSLLPEWMHNLFGQPSGIGRIKTLLNSASDPIPPKCSHTRKVTWAATVNDNEWSSDCGGENKIVLDPVKCRALNVSQRELVQCHYTNCSLACHYKCRHSDEIREDDDEDDDDGDMEGCNDAL